MTPPRQMTPASEWLGQCYTANYPEGFLAIIERAQAEARAAGYEEARAQAAALVKDAPTKGSVTTFHEVAEYVCRCALLRAIAALQPVTP